ncbi:radical SAM protein [Candidatus Fermentibacteria bacterium]|nr:radical SAM protein [Candidatus Fermentibacteria bacterium]
MRGARRAAQGLQALLFAAGRRTPLRGPAKLAWEVTERCNSRCLTCSRRDAAPEELSTEEGMSLIQEAASLGVLSLSFSGGEPLLRRDLPDLVREAARLRLHASISTNGLLLRGETARMALEAGLSTAYLSLDGCEATHDRIRGVPGGFRKVTEGARWLVSSHPRPRVFYNTTISRANLAELPAIAAQAMEDGVDGLTVQPAQIAPEVGLLPEPDLVLTAEDAADLARTLGSVVRRYPRLIPLPPRYLSDMPAFLRRPAMSQETPCVAGILHAVVGSTGEVFPCPVQFASLGSLREGSLGQVWRSPAARDLRRRIARGDHPPCWFNCVVPASLALSGLLPLGWLSLVRSPAVRHLLRRTACTGQ